MESESPLISIIIPFYRGEAFIDKLFQSLAQAISHCNSKLIRFEIVIIIDSPETESENLIYTSQNHFIEFSNVNVVIEKNPVNLGVASSRNRALLMCKGNYIHIIDQDDEIDPNFYVFTLSNISNFNFILVNGIVRYSNSKYNKHLLYYVNPRLSLKNLILDDFIRSPGQVIFSKELTDGVQFPITSKYKGADDKFFWVLMFHVNEKIKPIYIDSPLYYANIHESNYSLDNLNLQLSALENWEIIQSTRQLGTYRKYVKRNINYLRYITGQSINYLEKIDGIKEKLIYSFDINRLVRYFIKRK